MCTSDDHGDGYGLPHAAIPPRLTLSAAPHCSCSPALQQEPVAGASSRSQYQEPVPGTSTQNQEPVPRTSTQNQEPVPRTRNQYQEPVPGARPGDQGRGVRRARDLAWSALTVIPGRTRALSTPRISYSGVKTVICACSWDPGDRCTLRAGRWCRRAGYWVRAVGTTGRVLYRVPSHLTATLVLPGPNQCSRVRYLRPPSTPGPCWPFRTLGSSHSGYPPLGQ